MTTATRPRPALPADDPLQRLPTDVDLERDPAAALAGMPTDLDLPYSDGQPMDSPWHRSAMTMLIDSLEYHWRDRKDFYVGGDMFLYFSPEYVFNKDFRGPDFFVVKGADHTKSRRSWVTWDEGGLLPNVIVELASPTTVHRDRGEKKRLYGKTFRTPEYFIYDPETHTVEGWRLRGSDFGDPLEPDANGRLWSDELGLLLGPWDGEFRGEPDRWPRFFDIRGNVIPTGQEAEAALVMEVSAQAERDKAQILAQAERDKAEAHAEIARLKAELAALRNPPPQP